MKTRIYLDYNATAPMRPEARYAMMAVLDAPHNASSVHGYGREGRHAVEQARDVLADMVGVPAGQVVFNGGATEANNTVLRHFKAQYPDQPILVSAVEHLSVLEALPDAIRIPVTRDGVVDLQALEALLKAHTPSLVSVMIVNNETGVIQPIAAISAIAHRYGAMMHCDGVQALGRIDLDMGAMGIDFLSVSAHKIGGPQGVGALVMGLCGIVPVLLHGGGQEKKARAGTENVAGIAGFGAALGALRAEPDLQARLLRMRAHFEAQLTQISDKIIVHGDGAERVANTTMLSVPGASAETLMMALDLDGVAVSNGSACSSGTVRSSYVLEAMGFGSDISTAALRVSTGWGTTDADMARGFEILEKALNRLKL